MVRRRVRRSSKIGYLGRTRSTTMPPTKANSKVRRRRMKQVLTVSIMAVSNQKVGTNKLRAKATTKHSKRVVSIPRKRAKHRSSRGDVILRCNPRLLASRNLFNLTCSAISSSSTCRRRSPAWKTTKTSCWGANVSQIVSKINFVSQPLNSNRRRSKDWTRCK